MKRKRYSDEQDRFCPPEGRARDHSRGGLPQAGRIRATYYRWKKQFAGMGVVEISSSIEENAKLKRLWRM